MLRRINSSRWTLPDPFRPKQHQSAASAGAVKPPFCYIGNKARLAAWIISHFPVHKCYVEVCGGSGAVLLAKPPINNEVYNDVDANLWNFFRVLRDRKKAEELVALLDLTLYGRDEQRAARELWCPHCCTLRHRDTKGQPSVEWALNYYLLVGQSFNGMANNSWSSGPRPNHNKPQIYRAYREKFGPIIERMKHVQVENDSFEAVIPRYDTVNTLFFIDPPYVHDSRGRKDLYAYEMADEQHHKLLDLVEHVEGHVVLSGYDNRIYSQRLKHWRRAEKRVTVTGSGGSSKHKWEVLWMNF